MNKLVEYLFYDDVYGIAIRKVDSDSEFFYTKKPSFKYWYADPFVCHANGKEYVFVEALEYYNGLGRIAVAEVVGNTVGAFRIVIQEDFHLSFPNIFQYDNIWYMLPETSAAGQMRLYKATNFPYEWELDTILLDQVKYVDTIFHFLSDTKAIGLAYDLEIKKAVPILLDMKEKKMSKTELEGNYSLERPGGAIYEKKGKRYRVVQDCVRCYGDYLHFLNVQELSFEKMMEEEVFIRRGMEVVFDDGKQKEYIHTYNTDGVYEVIDFRYRKFYPLKALARFLWRFHVSQ